MVGALTAVWDLSGRMLSAGNASATSEENRFFGDLQLLLFPQESPPAAHPDW